MPFSPVDDFSVASFGERQALYQALCELIWSPENFGFEVPLDFERPASKVQEGQQRYYGVRLKDLLDVGLLQPNQVIVGVRNAVTCTATITADGHVLLADGRQFESPSMAGAAALGMQSCNGWHFWQTETPRGLARLTRVRDEYLERQRH